MSSGVFAMFVTHTVSSLATVRSYSSTFQMPVVMSRVAVNTSRALLSPAVPSLQAALGVAPDVPSAAAVPGKQQFCRPIHAQHQLLIMALAGVRYNGMKQNKLKPP